MMRYYYLGPWQSVTDPIEGTSWQPPEHTVGLVDLRPVADIENTGFFATDVPLTDSGYDYLGDQLDEGMTLSARSAWKSLLGLDSLDASTILDALWEVLTYRSDPDGTVRAKPILPTHKKTMELHLGGHSLIRSSKFRGVDDPAWPAIQRVLQNDYKGLVGRTKNLRRKWLGAMSRKYRLSPEAARDLIGNGKEMPLDPTTTITESFNQADSTTVGPDLTWTEVDGGFETVSNQLGVDGTYSSFPNSLRAEHDLSSDDHYARIDATTGNNIFGFYAPAVRFSSSAETCYTARVRSSENEAILKKIVTGTTLTALTASTWSPSWPASIYVEIDGSSLSLTVNSTTIDTITDTSITGNTRCGVASHNSSQNASRFADNFEAADLVASGGGGGFPFIRYYMGAA